MTISFADRHADFMPVERPRTADLRRGTIVRLDAEGDFGYVRQDGTSRDYFFAIGSDGVRPSRAGQLAVGRVVRFKLDGAKVTDVLPL